jgi:hypothetical protein
MVNLKGLGGLPTVEKTIFSQNLKKGSNADDLYALCVYPKNPIPHFPNQRNRGTKSPK